MSCSMDSPGPIRRGEELPLDRLAAYLRRQLPQFTGTLSVEQFPYGHSNLTYRLQLGAADLVLRRPPFGNEVKTAHDMGREFRVLSRLCNVFELAPRPFCFCDDPSVIGGPFYIMERRQGIILRSPPSGGVAIDSEAARRLSEAVIDNLAQLHALDYHAAGLGDLGKPDGYVTRQVAGWSKRYEQACTDRIVEMEQVARWLAEQLPTVAGAALIHNDYKHDNLVLDSRDLTRIVAVLDWEMATVGDPLLDLGTTLGYWVEATDPVVLRQAAFGPTALPGSLTRRELVERYCEKSKRPVVNATYYYVFGLFKIAVIVQQIYARFVRGHTNDPRFGNLRPLVAVLSQQADRAINAGLL